MNIHKNSFENVNFFAVFQKLITNDFKDYGHYIHNQNLKHIFIECRLFPNKQNVPIWFTVGYFFGNQIHFQTFPVDYFKVVFL